MIGDEEIIEFYERPNLTRDSYHSSNFHGRMEAPDLVEEVIPEFTHVQMQGHYNLNNKSEPESD